MVISMNFPGFGHMNRLTERCSSPQVLQSKVMMFSNQIAEIVHGVCNEFHGAPNKNTGETFLVIWKQHEDAGGTGF